MCKSRLCVLQTKGKEDRQTLTRPTDRKRRRDRQTTKQTRIGFVACKTTCDTWCGLRGERVSVRPFGLTMHFIYKEWTLYSAAATAIDAPVRPKVPSLQ